MYCKQNRMFPITRPCYHITYCLSMGSDNIQNRKDIRITGHPPDNTPRAPPPPVIIFFCLWGVVTPEIVQTLLSPGIPQIIPLPPAINFSVPKCCHGGSVNYGTCVGKDTMCADNTQSLPYTFECECRYLRSRVQFAKVICSTGVTKRR